MKVHLELVSESDVENIHNVGLGEGKNLDHLEMEQARQARRIREYARWSAALLESMARRDHRDFTFDLIRRDTPQEATCPSTK